MANKISMNPVQEAELAKAIAYGLAKILSLSKQLYSTMVIHRLDTKLQSTLKMLFRIL